MKTLEIKSYKPRDYSKTIILFLIFFVLAMTLPYSGHTGEIALYVLLFTSIYCFVYESCFVKRTEIGTLTICKDGFKYIIKDLREIDIHIDEDVDIDFDITSWKRVKGFYIANVPVDNYEWRKAIIKPTIEKIAYEYVGESPSKSIILTSDKFELSRQEIINLLNHYKNQYYPYKGEFKPSPGIKIPIWLSLILNSALALIFLYVLSKPSEIIHTITGFLQNLKPPH